MFNRRDFRVGLAIAALLHGGLLACAFLAVRGHLRAGRERSPSSETLVVVTIAEAAPVVAASVEPPPPAPPPPSPAPPEPAAEVPPPPESIAIAAAPPSAVAEIAEPETPVPEAPSPPVVAVPEPPPPIPVVRPPQPAPSFAGIPSFSAGELDIRPRYPIGARMRGEEGLVRLLVTVLPSGIADRVTVAESSGFPALDRAAIDAVKRSRFRKVISPGGASGEVLLSFRFQLVEARQSDSTSAGTAP